MEAGLHAPTTGFYARGRGPGTDFRTASTAAPDLLADALVVLFGRLPAEVADTVVEVGAGTGALLAALAERLPAAARLIGVERRDRPPGLPARIGWQAELPAEVRGLLLAVEWLDTVPVDVVVDGRVVLVDDDGVEHAGELPDPADAAWLDRWWPAGRRREVGRRRDEAWADAVRRVSAGAALAVDYGFTSADRPAAGTLRAYRAGSLVPLRPGTDRDVTATLFWPSVLAAAEAAAGTAGATLLTTQRAALRGLGLSGALPPRGRPDLAAALDRAARAATLLDPAGLGAFGWCLTGVEAAPHLLLAGPAQRARDDRPAR